MFKAFALSLSLVIAITTAGAQQARGQRFICRRRPSPRLQQAIAGRADHDGRSRRAVPEAHQGLQRHLRERAAGHPRSDHDDSACRTAQCAVDAQSAAGRAQDLGLRRSQGAKPDRSRRRRAPNMPDALEVAAAQDRQFKQTGRLVGPLHGVVMAIKDQYDTFDMRTTSGADAQYANDRPPDDATFVKRLRDAGAIILAKANMAEYATDGGAQFVRRDVLQSVRHRARAGHVERRIGDLGRGQPRDLRDRAKRPSCRFAGRRRSTTSSAWRRRRNWSAATA